MKNYKKPTRNQRKILENNYLNSNQWYVVKDMATEMEVISKSAISKGLNKTKTIPKDVASVEV